MFLYIVIHFNIFAFESILDLSTESVVVHYYIESEYIDAGYDIGENFTNGLEVYSATKDTKITLDGKTYRTETLLISDLPEGKYLLEIKSKGYETYKTYINIYNDKKTVMLITLSREYGYLNIETNTEKSEIFLNGYSITGSEPIPTGTYSLKIKSFGYTEQYRIIKITSNFTTDETFKMEKAPFKLERLKLNKSSINPMAAEGFSKLYLTVSVNGPGNGTIEIIDNNDNVVSQMDLIFTDWKTKLIFDRAYNLPIKNGSYRVVVSSSDQVIEENLTIDSTLYIKMLNSVSRTTGLLHTPTAEINSIPTHQSSFILSYNQDNNILSLPISYLYNFNINVELLTGFLLSLEHDDNIMIFSAYSSLKFVKEWGLLSSSLNIQYQFLESDWQNIFTFNLPLTYNMNNISVTLTPGFEFDLDMNYTLSGSFGLHYDNQSIRSGLSLTVDDNVDYAVGYEFWKLIKNSQTYMGVYSSYNSNSLLDIGIGINNLY